MSEVRLHVYDLSRGMATGLARSILNLDIEGVWHTGVVVYNIEYFFGGGIQALEPAQVSRQFNLTPTKTLTLGNTNISRDAFHAFLTSISHKYTAQTYNLFNNNCNNFSNEIVKFLTNNTTGIPGDILDLPNRVLSTPIGQSIIGPIYNQLQQNMFSQLNSNPHFDPLGNTNSNTNLIQTGTQNPTEKLQHLKELYSPEIVELFSKMKNNKVEQLVNVFEDLLYVSSITGLKTLKEKISFDCVVYVFNSKDKSQTRLTNNEVKEELKSKKDVEIFDIDVSTTTNPEEYLEVTSSFISDYFDAKKKILLLSQSGNNGTFAAVLNLLVEKEVCEDFVSLLKRVKEKAGSFYVRFELLKVIAENADKEALEVVKKLHVESPTSELLNVVREHEKEMKEKIVAIKEMGIEAEDEVIRSVLETAKGDVNAALNLLL